MTTGIRIAKPDYSQDGTSDQIYVDSTTPLFKVHMPISGALVYDGSTVTSTGDYTWINTSGATYQLTIPHNLGYTPFFTAYMDALGGSRRRYLSTFVSGVSLDGDLRSFAMADCFNVTLTSTFIGTPIAGNYGYFVYIFKDMITPIEVSPKVF